MTAPSPDVVVRQLEGLKGLAKGNVGRPLHRASGRMIEGRVALTWASPCSVITDYLAHHTTLATHD